MPQGDEERELLKEENVVNATLTEYLEEAKLVRRSVIKVDLKRLLLVSFRLFLTYAPTLVQLRVL